jgi:hypothetical protein
MADGKPTTAKSALLVSISEIAAPPLDENRIFKLAPSALSVPIFDMSSIGKYAVAPGPGMLIVIRMGSACKDSEKSKAVIKGGIDFSGIYVVGSNLSFYCRIFS